MKKYITAAIAAIMILSGCSAGDGGLSSGQTMKTQPPTEPDVIYSDYAEFASDYKAENPDAYELPLPENTEDMQVDGVALGSNRYTVSYDTNGTEDVQIVVEYTMVGCNSIEAFLAAQNNIPDSEITEQTEEYLIRKYQNGKLELTALYGEKNTVCRLTVQDDALTYDQLRQKLLEYKEKMGM